jgi:hypothetical protein
MAKRITIADEEELKNFKQINFATWGTHIFFLDACAVEHNTEVVKELVKEPKKGGTGNFRISHVAFNELDIWKKPRDRAKHKVWKEVKGILIMMKEFWPNNIVKVNPGVLFNDLMLLSPLLSKTLTFNLVMGLDSEGRRVKETFKEIFTIIKRRGIDPRALKGTLFGEFQKEVMGKFLEACDKLKTDHGITIRDKEELARLFVPNIANTLEGIIVFMQDLIDKGYDLESVRTEVTKRFENKTKNDALILEHYLLTRFKHMQKHLPTEDKDIYELAVLHSKAI